MDQKKLDEILKSRGIDVEKIVSVFEPFSVELRREFIRLEQQHLAGKVNMGEGINITINVLMDLLAALLVTRCGKEFAADRAALISDVLPSIFLLKIEGYLDKEKKEMLVTKEGLKFVMPETGVIN